MRTLTILVGTIGLCVARPAAAQTVWDVFIDTESESTCGVVNTADSELVVLSGPSQLMIVSRIDTILEDTFVDANAQVTFEGQPAGVIEFAEDADGFRTLWWVTLTTGQVVQLDPFTAEPFASDLFPLDIRNVPCDACEFVDNPPSDTCWVDGGSDNPLVPIILNFCGAGVGSSLMLAMTFCGFVGLRSIPMRRG